MIDRLVNVAVVFGIWKVLVCLVIYFEIVYVVC